MKNRSPIFWGLLLFFCFTYGFSYQQIHVENQKQKVASLPPLIFRIPIPLLQSIVGEFKGLVANYAVIEAASIIGKSDSISKQEWSIIHHLLRSSFTLDPYFEQTAHLSYSALSWLEKNHLLSLEFQEISRSHRYWDWTPGYFKGFIHFFFLKDHENAAKEFVRASTIKKAPIALQVIAARLQQRSGQTQAAILFLENILKNESDYQKREVIEKRLSTLKKVRQLEKAIQRFYTKQNRFPQKLEELVSFKEIRSLPENPYRENFLYDPATGEVDF